MLRIENLVFDAWGRRFFDGASVAIPSGTKVGLVGRNGVGKSTLFKIIRGDLAALSGDILLPKSARIGSVDQEHPATPVTLLDTVLAADTRREELNAALEVAAPEEMAEIYQHLATIDADRAPARAAEILNGLGFSTADLQRPMAEFSGGWRMRVALAAALFAEPDLLLLDEPTNYLDLEGALWLEARLKKYPNTALIISHDRELLNNSVDAILHLSAGKLELYSGGYNQFETRRAEKSRLQTATRAKQEAERAHLQRFIDRFRAKASKATQAQSRIKRLAKLEPIAEVVEERVAPFTLPSPTRPLAPPLVALESACVGYDGKPVLAQSQSAARRRRPHRASWRQRRRQIDLRQDVGGCTAAVVGPDERASSVCASAGFINIRSRRSILPIRRSKSCGASGPRTANPRAVPGWRSSVCRSTSRRRRLPTSPAASERGFSSISSPWRRRIF